MKLCEVYQSLTQTVCLHQYEPFLTISKPAMDILCMLQNPITSRLQFAAHVYVDESHAW